MFDTLKRKVAAKTMGVSDARMAEMQEMQRKIAEIQYKHEEDGIMVKLSGDSKIQYLEINGERRDDIKKVLNKAHDKMQHEVSKKMMNDAGGLSGLLKGF